MNDADLYFIIRRQLWGSVFAIHPTEKLCSSLDENIDDSVSIHVKAPILNNLRISFSNIQIALDTR
jgi:hypothetical protein